MTRKLTVEMKERIYKENEDLLLIIYDYGGGAMLRQQVLKLASKKLDKTEIQIQKSLSRLLQAGFVRTAPIFSSCTNRVIVLSNYPASRLAGKGSRNVWVCEQSQRNLLYLTCRTEILIEGFDYYDCVRQSPILTTKNNASNLYSWFGKRFSTTSKFADDQEVEKGFIPRHNIYGEPDFSKFNFKSMLQSGFVIWDAYKIENQELILFYINSNNVSVKKFFRTTYCLLYMLSTYTDERFDKIHIFVSFFSKEELLVFKRKWDKHYKSKLLELREVRLDIINACDVQFASLDLDKKYNLRRDIRR